jgi:hypothetical protein
MSSYEQEGEQGKPLYRSEDEEREAFMREKERMDEDARDDRYRVEDDNYDFTLVIDDICDLTKKCGIPDIWSLGSALDYLVDDGKRDELTETAPPSSNFYRRPERVLKFIEYVKYLIADGVVIPDLSLAEALDVLGKKREENKGIIGRAITLDVRDKKRGELTQFKELCSYIDEIPRDLHGDLEVERYKHIENQEVKEERLVVTIRPNNNDFDNIMARLKKVPRASVDRKGKRIILSMVVEKRFLDVARESFPWIPKDAQP